ncbi:MAG: translation initiation factor IF-2 [Weizmannia coagulans]|jgi:translation initiation factor IF-2|uniref:translation initiation factor IF-2 n=1 Tax=Heyndrickxia TaxID=2837504 RepID=UPI0008F8FE05|nr:MULTISPECIES: translation initiation factor IF-2 [Heyndrickxia]NWN94161.1 translation initiation factor IF-2 [Bacillus sp. (in: firmicutes)]APB35929.1 translation initiation factor IF-2 [Heyndrickxia coagulans]AVD55890.1 translation initiation factor IF-2 [Heyndrickxia coagulans]MCI1575433.1 translation initiation factor IF-2 [Heyndrickxia coagulans]MED4839668.1 translation initiation factor IF-2 [Weizmannia sp. CD-2023]
MSKIRVYEYAKAHHTSSKEIITKLKQMNIEVSNHMSMIDGETVRKLDTVYSGKNQQDGKKNGQNGPTRNERSTRSETGDRQGNKPENRTRRENQKPNHGNGENRANGNGQNSKNQGNNGNSRNNNNNRSGGSNRSDGKSRTGGNNRNNRNGQTGGNNRSNGNTQAASNNRNNENSQAASNNRNNGNSQNTSNNRSNGNTQAAGNNRNNQNSGNSRNNGNNRNSGNGNRSNNGNRGNNGRPFNKQKKNNRKNKNFKPQPQPVQKVKELPEKITFTESLTVAELAKKLYREPSEIIKKLFLLGVAATINQQLDKDAIELIASEYGVEVEEKVIVDQTDLETYFTEDREEDLEVRPPVVTIMGHVDHGKTTTLDSIRHTKVTAGEAGGITQHIGAYQVKVGGKKITFLDTPGHEAFTTMRARGAQVTDITVLVVAADDGVKPQTVEAINHAKAAGVPIIVAVNKIDKPTANPERVMQELTEYNLVPEDWGGDTIFVPISALTGEGIDNLLEMILLVSEVEELKANPNRRALGSVIEARLDKGRGPVATLLVQNGTLRIGDPIVVGHTYGRVRAMVNDLGRRVKEAGPSTPVEITGLNDVPEAGDRFVVFEDEKTARQVGEARKQQAVQAHRNETARVSLDTLFEQMKQGEMKELNVIVKADVQGSVEALTAALQKIDVEGVNINVIHTGVGAINESDVTLASASNAIIIGFNVRPDNNAKRAAETEKVDIRLHRIIYKAIEEIESAMKGMLDPEYKEKIIGQVEVRQTFKVSRIGTIAGGYVTDGKITRDSGVRVIRDGVVIYEGVIDTLKRYKDDVKEVNQGYECGITIKNFNDIKEGDVIESFIMEEIERA